MSLQRLSQRLRQHDWFAAIIEVMIVIVGILIALQVDNWNEDRQDRNRARNFAQRLHAGLESDLRNAEATRVFWEKVVGYQAAATRHGETGDQAGGNAWQTVLSYYQASQLRPYELDDTTFHEMRDAGDLRLLDDAGLRRDLAAYYRHTGSSMTGEILRHAPDYRIRVRGLTPYPVQEYIWATCWRQRSGADQDLIDCPSPITDAEAQDILSAYAGDPQLLKDLRFWRSQMGISLEILGGIEAQARALDAKVLVLAGAPPAQASQ